MKNGMMAKKTAKGSTATGVVPAKLERELARVGARRENLWNELSAHSAAMNERAAQGPPVQRLLAVHHRMRERYCVVENRRQELLAVVPARPMATEDF